MFYGFTSETFGMSIPFIAVGIVGVVICFYFAQKMENVRSELKLWKNKIKKEFMGILPSFGCRIPFL